MASACTGQQTGSESEALLLKELTDAQKLVDPLVKDWARLITDAMTAINVIMLHIRKALTESAEVQLSPKTVFLKMRALLADFAKEMGVKGGTGKPSIRTHKDFTLLFEGKNPITGFHLVTAEGQDVEFTSDNEAKGSAMQFIYNTFFNPDHPSCLCAHSPSRAHTTRPGSARIPLAHALHPLVLIGL